MLGFQEGREPQFTVLKLKGELKDIGRNDLAKKLEQCSLPDTATLRHLRLGHPETFESICLQMDHFKNWAALGRKLIIPNDKLEQIGTSSSCAKTVLDSIEKKRPTLTVKEMKAALQEMQRKDVCNVLNKYLSEDSTIVTLRGKLDCLEEVSTLLDKETPGLENWLHFARAFGLSRVEGDYLKPKGNPSPTKSVMVHITQVHPDLTVKQFIQMLVKMKRIDVVNALKESCCDLPTTREDLDGTDTTCINQGVGALGLQDEKLGRQSRDKTKDPSNSKQGFNGLDVDYAAFKDDELNRNNGDKTKGD